MEKENMEGAWYGVIVSVNSGRAEILDPFQLLMKIYWKNKDFPSFPAWTGLT